MIALTGAGLSYAEATGVRWPEARALADAAERTLRERLIATACAMRAAQAPEKAWRDWLRAIERTTHGDRS